MPKFPIFIENSKIPKILSKIAPINIGAITLGPIVLGKGKLSERTRRHEHIHYLQYKETLFVGFLIIYFYDYFKAFRKYGRGRESYKAIRFEQEAHGNDKDKEYLDKRKGYAWRRYKI